MFLNEKWSDYVTEYPELSERHRHVSPRMVHGLLIRWTQKWYTCTSLLVSATTFSKSVPVWWYFLCWRGCYQIISQDRSTSRGNYQYSDFPTFCSLALAVVQRTTKFFSYLEPGPYMYYNSRYTTTCMYVALFSVQFDPSHHAMTYALWWLCSMYIHYDCTCMLV